ncbi:hypothetical protein GCM10010977_19320 [Citricoccus zhacaiensis]|uniref:Uncharacterized protein n=1 Tax=Citricoccus zhacaiensis TaxID=489142 RepID=A0ABQ2M1M7_9MICC|nr:hypothetical protein [Citricoccus zhacaiensis]GGO45788.1 hypothetical protein GCM10010977_19320 [Citricoccus zhacaiensis]
MVIKYDAGASAAYEWEVGQIADRIEGILGDREQQKAYVEENYEATNTSEDLSAVEAKWLNACEQVRDLVREAKSLMEKNDVTASEAARAAGVAVGGMGG